MAIPARVADHQRPAADTCASAARLAMHRPHRTERDGAGESRDNVSPTNCAADRLIVRSAPRDLLSRWSLQSGSNRHSIRLAFLDVASSS